MNFDLSICIPTFNRALVLEELLNKMAKELEGLETRVELCVSDNASPDETEKYVNSFSQKNPKITIKYNKNTTNLGFDRNCELALRMAKGKYLWIFSDDDYLKAGAVKKVLTKLEEDQPELVFINYQIKVKEENLLSSAQSASIKTYGIREAVENINLANTMISSIIYSAEALRKVNLKSPNGTFWYHFVLFYEVIQKNPKSKVLYYGSPLIIQKGLSIEDARLEKSFEYRGPLEWYIEAYFSLLKVVHEKKIFKELDLITKLEKALIRQIIYYRIGNVNQSADIKLKILSILGNYEFSKIDKIAVAFILILPQKLVKIAVAIKKVYKKYING